MTVQQLPEYSSELILWSDAGVYCSLNGGLSEWLDQEAVGDYFKFHRAFNSKN